MELRPIDASGHGLWATRLNAGTAGPLSEYRDPFSKIENGRCEACGCFQENTMSRITSSGGLSSAAGRSR